MRKIFTLIAALMMAAGINAAEQLNPEAFTLGSKISLAAGWDGKYAWLGDADWSGYDKVWIKYADCEGTINFGICYNEWVSKESWGDNFKTVTSKIPEGTGGVFGIDIDNTSVYVNGSAETDGLYKGEVLGKHVRQIQIQDESDAASITIQEVWIGTTAEYEAALAGNAPVASSTKKLSLTTLSGGWGEGTTYDAATQTITIGDDWSGKGWWLASWDNDAQANVAANYSDFDKLVVEFAQPTPIYGNVVVEYDGGIERSSFSFNTGAEVIVVDLDPAGKAAVNQVYIQGPSGAQYVLKSVYFSTTDAAPAIINPEPQTAQGIVWTTSLTQTGVNENGNPIYGQAEFAASANPASAFASLVVTHEGDQAVTGGTNYKGDNADHDFVLYDPAEKNAPVTVTWTATLNEGVTFSVEKVALNMVRVGTDGGVITISVKVDDTETTLAEDLIPQRNNKEAGEDKFAGDAKLTSKWESEASGTATKSVALVAVFKNLASGKQIGYSDVQILGTVVDAAGIDEVKTVRVATDAIYNLAGQKVDAQYKGVVIKNGKKLIQK